jgi:hypothetical protein
MSTTEISGCSNALKEIRGCSSWKHSHMHIIMTRIKKAEAIGIKEDASAVIISRRTRTLPKMRRIRAILSSLRTTRWSDMVESIPDMTIATSRRFHGEVKNLLHQLATIFMRSSITNTPRKKMLRILILLPIPVSEPSKLLRSSMSCVSTILSTKFWREGSKKVNEKDVHTSARIAFHIM